MLTQLYLWKSGQKGIFNFISVIIKTIRGDNDA